MSIRRKTSSKDIGQHAGGMDIFDRNNLTGNKFCNKSVTQINVFRSVMA